LRGWQARRSRSSASSALALCSTRSCPTEIGRDAARRRAALVESYGVRAVTRLLRARRAGPAIVDEARRRDAELVVLGAPRHAVAGGRRLFGGTVDYVLREAPCRVLVAAGKRVA
jgi:nucleotide-binding universal stress UspA family protein